MWRKTCQELCVWSLSRLILTATITIIGGEKRKKNFSLLSESVPLLLAPHVHDLPVLVNLHGVVHQSVHVDELDALLLGVEQHRGDDGQLPHLFIRVLHVQHRREKESKEREKNPGVNRLLLKEKSLLVDMALFKTNELIEDKPLIYFLFII